MIEFTITTSVLLFLISGVLIWYFSYKLSELVEFITQYYKLGSAFGATIILSLIVNLPEVVIVAYGTYRGDTSLALGNILGGIAIQTVLLVLFDFASRKEKLPLTTLTSNVNSITQGLFLSLILGLVILGAQIKEDNVMFKAAPIEILILVAWFLSLFLVKKCENMSLIPEQASKEILQPKYNVRKTILSLIAIGILILFFGVLLAHTSEKIAEHFHVTGVIFGATILSLITALPEISGGLTFVKHKQYQAVISDIFGGNAFLPLLFLLASVIGNRSILTDALKTDVYLTSLSIILTLTFTIGMVIKSPRRFWNMGLDSWVALIIYSTAIFGLILI